MLEARGAAAAPTTKTEISTITVKFTPNDLNNPAGKLADAELPFDDGPLAGLKLMRAPLWLLDEPTTNLDTAGQGLVSRLITEHVSQGGLVMAAVHHELPIQSRPVRRLDLATA